MVYILYISEINPPDQKEIDRIISIHENDQDSVIIKSSGKKLDGGFDIVKEDNLVSYVIRRDKEAKESLDRRVTKAIAKEAKVIRDGAKYNKDTSVLEGAEPYKK